MDDSVDQILSEYKALQHWERREYKAALEHAAAAAEKALTKADTIGYLRMALLLAECQLELGQMQEFAASAKELSEHPALQDDARILVRAKVLYSRALEALGHISEALALAEEAAAMNVAPTLDPVAKLGMLHGLVAALTESSREVEAWKYAKEMALLAAEQDDQEVAGKAYWAVGIVAFLLNDAENGIYYHRLAADNLAPGNDVNTWAMFNKSSALARLSAGIVEPETLACIERAELAMSVTGVSPLQELEISIARAHWLLLAGGADESVARLQRILEQRELLPEHTLAEVEYVAALALHELGRNDEALVAAVHSEKVFIGHGSRRRALEARSVIDSIARSGQ
ncbi:hypothetical protein MUG94_05060 [Arthrobacter gengyunqii]|uniref:Tetratricopeptide repeat protein n=1 Tax=Arthrobacter gengyunqii TaxID=2886940 RepID=A0A9X1M1G5_9MICC|nr:hypothetical protein [Arthrobacter gengyunqii]MCC3269678.1 hypothetical protein [Arthrobacter gengyunqii]UOY97136.1 hypothetical protein MUG94_05060 [Arthrobacter gengyunqii]